MWTRCRYVPAPELLPNAISLSKGFSLLGPSTDRVKAKHRLVVNGQSVAADGVCSIS